MLTTGVICVARGLTPVKFDDQRCDANHSGAQQQRTDGVGEVVVRHGLPDHAETSDDPRENTAHNAEPATSTSMPITMTIAVM